MRLKWLLVALGLAVILLIAHLYALAHFWYWEYRWIDTPMHLLAGMATGAAIVGVLHRFRPRTYVLVIVLAAIGWEIFEYTFGISTNQPDYWLDTFHDVLNDFLGAIILYLIARYTIWRSR